MVAQRRLIPVAVLNSMRGISIKGWGTLVPAVDTYGIDKNVGFCGQDVDGDVLVVVGLDDLCAGSFHLLEESSRVDNMHVEESFEGLDLEDNK